MSTNCNCECAKRSRRAEEENRNGLRVFFKNDVDDSHKVKDYDGATGTTTDIRGTLYVDKKETDTTRVLAVFQNASWVRVERYGS